MDRRVSPCAKWLRRLGFATLAFCAVSTSGAQGYVPHRLLVKFTNGTPPAAAQSVLGSVGARIEKDLPQIGVKVVSLPPNANEASTANYLSHRPYVEFVELDGIVPVQTTTPSDPWFPNQWHLTRIGAPAAWDVTCGSSNVIIAILDTGVDGTHPDLAGLMVPGWNVYNNNNNTADVLGHGTSVAGCAAAMSNNGLGVASVSWNSRLMPIRISDTAGTATYSAMAAGLTWAADHGAKVANISYIASDNSTVRSAAQYFMNHGGVVTAAAGNYSTNMTGADNPYILTVSASDVYDGYSTTTNYGASIDVAAPGVTVWTTIVGGYQSRSGTSMSAPIVAGVAALTMSANPLLSAAQVQQIIKDSAEDKGAPGWDPYFGYGRVNAFRAVSMAAGSQGGGTGDTTAPTVAFSQPSEGMTLQGVFTVSAQASDNVGVSSMSVSIDGVQVASSTSGLCNYSWTTTNSANGAHVLQATARDAAGNVSTATVNVNLENVVDTSPPAVTIVNPTGGSVSTTVPVAVNATDNVAVARVELYVDGKLSGSATSAPFGLTWNAKKARPGNHTLQTKAYDAAGNSSWSQAVTVTK
jgi:thermitase